VPHVAWLTIAPVKGLALVEVDEIALGRNGVAENRRFYLVDADERRYGLLRDGRLALVQPAYDSLRDRLEFAFPDGSVVAGEIAVDGEVTTDFYGRPVTGRLVRGPWSEALSEHVGRSVRLVRADDSGAAVDRRSRGSVSMLSEASLEELRRRAGREEPVDPARFRMLIGIGGVGPHEEDEWVGRRVRVGEAVVLLHEQVARCAITTQNPKTGVPDFDTLREIKAYRGARDRKLIDFGVYGEVDEPGRVRLGDPIEPL
jgi:MOSC domain-containing protein